VAWRVRNCCGECTAVLCSLALSPPTARPPPSYPHAAQPHADGLARTCCRETYQYYNLPFCQPTDGKEYKTEFLGEVLEGDRLVTTPYKIQYRKDVENAVLCKKSLTGEDLKKFRDAVKQDYYFQARQPMESRLRQLAQHVMSCTPKCSHIVSAWGFLGTDVLRRPARVGLHWQGAAAGRGSRTRKSCSHGKAWTGTGLDSSCDADCSLRTWTFPCGSCGLSGGSAPNHTAPHTGVHCAVLAWLAARQRTRTPAGGLERAPAAGAAKRQPRWATDTRPSQPLRLPNSSLTSCATHLRAAPQPAPPRAAHRTPPHHGRASALRSRSRPA
jgi:hypothetical protein